MSRYIACIALLLLTGACIPQRRPADQISCTVLSADAESNRVVLDVGKSDGVELGMTFVITTAQGKRSMPNARVIKVEALRCVTTYPGVFRTPVRPGDEAQGVLTK